MSLYTKHRPQDFTSIVGQEHIVDILKAQLLKKSYGHAYLFYGSRGIGKTTLARIFAKELGTNPEDTYEIDGASNRKIEDIRDLRENVQLLPLTSPYKVYIIDEVHMLTKEAFNALLKTLEEPPSHVIFILATTEMHKVPETIISRCQVLTLRRPSSSLIKTLLKKVAEKENLYFTEDGYDAIALLGKGSFRDALSTLEQISSLADIDGTVSDESVYEVTGVVSRSTIHSFLTAIAEKDFESASSAITSLEESNQSSLLFIERIIDTLRMLLRARFLGKSRDTFVLEIKTNSHEEYNFVVKYVGTAGKDLNADVLKKFLEVYAQQQKGDMRFILLELALFEILRQDIRA